MKIISNDDGYSDALSTAMIATIPFITIGIADHPVVLYASSVSVILLFCSFMARLIITLKKPETVRPAAWLTELVSLLQLPYATALSSLILINEGIEMAFGLWFSLAYAIVATAWCIHESKIAKD